MKRQHNTKYYKRVDRGKDSDSSGGEETELFIRNKSPKKELPTVERVIEDGDTLQALAIRYYCTVEELKRLNNIHKDNEIYARRKLKVPHRPFCEALAVVHKNDSQPSTSKLIDIDEPVGNDQVSEVNEIIFNSNIATKECENLTQSAEDVSLLPQNTTVQPDPIISKLNCNGSDWDISYPALVICIVLVIFAIPLIYVFYIAEHIDQYRNHTHLNAT